MANSHHHRVSAPPPIPIPSRLYSSSFPSPFPATPSAASTPSKRRRPLHHHSSSSVAAASLLIPLFSLRSLYSLLPFVRSYSASISLFPFAFLVSLLSFALSLLIPSPEPLKSLPPRSLLRPLAAKSALLTLTLLLRFHSLRYCSAGAAILADLAGSLLAKTLSDIRAPNPRRRIIGVAALATAVSLLSYSWDRIGCFPISSSPPPSEGCSRIAPMVLPFLSGFLGFYERAFANWGSLRQLGRRRVRLLSLGLATAFLFVPACASFVLADSSDGDGLSVGSLGWPLINTVVFGVVLSENYGDDKLLFSAKDFRRDFLVNFFCTLVLELFYFPKLSLPGFLFCGFLLWIGVRELGSSSLSYVELGSSDPPESLSSTIMNPIRHILNERKSRKIALFLLINTAYMVVEFVVGFMSNSLGLISDACHMLFDCAALAIGLYASYISRLPANSDFNYGRGRFEVLSGYVNAVFLVLVGALIVLESLERILDPQEISTNSLLAVSIGGLLVNVIGLIFFHEEHHHAHGGAATCSHSHLHSHDHHHHHHDHHDHQDCKHANEGGGHFAENQHNLVVSHVDHEHHGHHHHNNQSENNSSNCHGHGHEDHNHSHEHGHHDKLCSDQLHTDHVSRKHKNSHEGSHSVTTQPLQSSESSVREKLLGESHKHHHIDHNMEGIFLHVLADTMGSVGVVISTLLIKYKGWTVADPACSIFISVMIVSSVLPLLRNSAEILLQRVPRGREQDLRLAINEISRIKGVQSIQNMHVWNFTNTEIVGTLHLHVSAKTDTASAANTASKLLQDVGIKDLTIQVECVKGLQIPNSSCIAKFATTVAGASTAASTSLVRPPRPRQVGISTPLSFRYLYHSLSPTLRTKKPLPGGCKLLVCAEKSSTSVVQQYTSMGSSKEPQEYNSNLYPHIEPYSTGFLKVSDIHTLYWEQSGNPNGHPVVFLHGGPGAGTSASNRRFFDPEFYRIILLDQRGAGKSTPHACLVDNTTWDLIGDIEKLREHLGIPEWQVFGGSWGSTLALAYSQLHPDKVTGIILRGIFLLRKKELDWFYEGGAAAIFPDAWEPFRDFIPEEERDNFILAYNKRLNSDDLDVQIKAAKIWTTWELMTAHLLQNEDNVKRGEDDIFSLAFARIENHYFINKGFLPSGSYMLDNVDKIRHIRTVIVQGRYDVCCPMMSAWDLHKAWPEAEFKVISDAGHSANEPGIAAALVAANEKFKNLIQSGAP